MMKVTIDRPHAARSPRKAAMTARSSPRPGALSSVIVACLAVFSAYVPLAAVMGALPTIQRGLHLSSSNLTWVTDAEVIPMAAFILFAGTLADLIGRRRVLFGGLVLVIVGSGLGLASGSSLDLLFVAQATLGTGAAVLLPSSLAVISQAIPDPARRAPAVGAWASTLAAAIAVGSWLTTLVVTTIGAHWQWLYVALLPWPLLALALGARGIKESKAPEGRSLDVAGQLAGMTFVVAAVYAVIQGPGHGWGSTLVIVSFAIAAVALLALVIVEGRVRAPMLPPQLFRSPAFAATGVVAALLMFALIGMVFVLVLFFGSVQHLSIAQIALRLLVLFGAFAIVGPPAGRLVPRIGARATMTLGLLIAAGGLVSLLGVHPDTTLADLWWRLALIGVGEAIVLTAMTATAVASVPPALAGLAGSSNNAIRQTGGALGPAVLGAVLTSRIISEVPNKLADQHVAHATAAHLSGLVSAHGSAAIGSLTQGRTLPIVHAAGDAFASGLHTTAIIGAIALLAAVIPVLALARSRRHATTALAETEAEQTGVTPRHIHRHPPARRPAPCPEHTARHSDASPRSQAS